MKVALISILVLLTGCVDRGKCLRSYEEIQSWTQQVQVGSMSCGPYCSTPIYTYINHTGPVTVCDEWQYPEGRKK